MKPEVVSIDFETFSHLDLLKVGDWNYSKHWSTEVIWLAYAWGDNKPKKFSGKSDIQRVLKKLLHLAFEGEIVLSAWNVAFETNIIANTLDFTTYSIDFNHWTDSMAMAGAMALPQSLAMCGQALRIPEEKMKFAEGKDLINKLSKLQTAKENKWVSELMFDDHNEYYQTTVDKNGNTIIEYRNRDPELVEQFGEYCCGDVEAERHIRSLLRPLSETERQIWVQTLELNQRGMYVDLNFCKHAIRMFQRQKKIELAEIKKITRLDNPNSRDQVKAWLADNGVIMPNLQKETIAEAVKDPRIVGAVERVLHLRHSSAKSPPTKYATMVMRTDKEDSRFRGAIWYHRASTGREGSSGVNWQNLYRPTFSDLEGACEWISEAHSNPDRYDDIELVYGGVMEALSSCVRGAVIPSPGCELVDVDYSAVEGRVLAWLAGERSKLDVYRGDGKAYEAAASRIYQVAIDDVSESQRFVGKTTELACGYQGGYGSLIGMAARYGVDFESYRPEGWTCPPTWFEGFWDNSSFKDVESLPYAVYFAQETVSKWRKISPKTVELWSLAEEAAHAAIANPGSIQVVNEYLVMKVVRIKDMKYLFMRLPSGRSICYTDPHIGKGKFGVQIQYYGLGEHNHWTRKSTYGGDIVQSATQGVARDLLMLAKLRCRDTHYKDIVLTIHDQALAEVPIGTGDVDEFGKLLCQLPKWAKGLPLDYDGKIRMRFNK